MLFLFFRGKLSFDQSGVGESLPGEVKEDDSQYDVYRKRMMLAYRFRPNPLVSAVLSDIETNNLFSTQNNPRRPYY